MRETQYENSAKEMDMTYYAKRVQRTLLALLVITLMASAFTPPAIAQDTKVMEDTITIVLTPRM